MNGEKDETRQGSLVPEALIPEEWDMVRVRTGALGDASGLRLGAQMTLERGGSGRLRVAAVGEDEGPRRGPEDHVVDLSDCVVIPGLVNAHAHLDLTHIGPRAHDPGEGFVSWIGMILRERLGDEDKIADSVRLGAARSLAGGVVAVGDIGGIAAGDMTAVPARALGETPLVGVSFVEFLGIGSGTARTKERLGGFVGEELAALRGDLEGSGVRVGLSPHAPNTVDLSLYGYAAELSGAHGLPVCTHLAETLEEREFVGRGTGPQKELLERFGVWDETVMERVGKGKHPVGHLLEILARGRVLAAHVNDVGDAEIAALAMTETDVVYCPRAYRYFGHEDALGGHRYTDMLAAGINVCLGTDSVVNLDTADRISVLDDVRVEHAARGVDPGVLLAMVTVNPAAALGMDVDRFRFGVGCEPAGVLALSVGRETAGASAGALWDAVMRRDDGPRWVVFQA